MNSVGKTHKRRLTDLRRREFFINFRNRPSETEQRAKIESICLQRGRIPSLMKRKDPEIPLPPPVSNPETKKSRGKVCRLQIPRGKLANRVSQLQTRPTRPRDSINAILKACMSEAKENHSSSSTEPEVNTHDEIPSALTHMFNTHTNVGTTRSAMIPMRSINHRGNPTFSRVSKSATFPGQSEYKIVDDGQKPLVSQQRSKARKLSTVVEESRIVETSNGVVNSLVDGANKSNSNAAKFYVSSESSESGGAVVKVKKQKKLIGDAMGMFLDGFMRPGGFSYARMSKGPRDSNGNSPTTSDWGQAKFAQLLESVAAEQSELLELPESLRIGSPIGSISDELLSSQSKVERMNHTPTESPLAGDPFFPWHSSDDDVFFPGMTPKRTSPESMLNQMDCDPFDVEPSGSGIEQEDYSPMDFDDN